MSELPISHPLCKRCGACCLHIRTPPFLPGDAEFHDLPPQLQLEVVAAREWKHNQGPCLWLDFETRRCRHYDQRPWLCRNLDVAGMTCRAARRLCGLGDAEETTAYS